MAVFYGSTQVAGGATCKFSEDSVRSACSSAVSSTLSDDITNIYGKIDTLSTLIGESNYTQPMLDYGAVTEYKPATSKYVLSCEAFPFDARVQGETGYSAVVMKIDGVDISGAMMSRFNVTSSTVHWQADVPAGVQFQLSGSTKYNIIPFRYGQKLIDSSAETAAMSAVFQNSALTAYLTPVYAKSTLNSGYVANNGSTPPWDGTTGSWTTSLLQHSSAESASGYYLWRANMKVSLLAKADIILKFTYGSGVSTLNSNLAYKYAVGEAGASPSTTISPGRTVHVKAGQYLNITVTKDNSTTYSPSATIGVASPNKFFESVTVQKTSFVGPFLPS